MVKRTKSSALALIILVGMVIVGTANAYGQDAAAVVAATARNTGAESLRTLVLTGSGSVGTLGQNLSPTAPWPLVRLKTYTRSTDFSTLAANLETIRIQNNTETSQSQVIPAGAPWTRQADLWVATPFAFLTAASANAGTLRSEVVDGVRYNVVSVKVDGKYTVDGYISDKNLVERIRTHVDNDVLGDMAVEGVYRDYKEFGGVKVPTLTLVTQAGFPTLIAGVADAKVNVPVSIPAAPAATTPAPTVEAERIANGIYYLKGGSHHSVLVEFADHLTLIEAPQNEARSVALLQTIRKLYPRKPLTQVVNTHHHFDHAGGLRTFVDAGATIVTHEVNKPFLEAAFKAPRTLSPDRLAASKRTATITGVADQLVLSDATRTLEIHALKGNPHDEGMLVVFLPAEKILVEVDMYTPPAPNAPRPAEGAPVNPNALALLTTLEKLRLDFDTILPLHGAMKATRGDLYAFTGKTLVPVSELPVPDGVPPIGRGGRPRGEALPPPPVANP